MRSILRLFSTATIKESAVVLNERASVCRRFSTATIKESVEMLNERALLQFQKGQFVEAGKLFAEASQIAPVAETYYNLGTCYLLSKKFQEAASAYHQTLELDPSHSFALSNLGNLYATRLGSLEKAVEFLQRAARESDTDGEIRFNLGAVLEKLGDLAAAEKEFERAVELGVDRARENLRSIKVKSNTSP